ncbi:MAG: CDP-alcohol phosphatidyltransferase family protein [Pseudomonadota bacterium]
MLSIPNIITVGRILLAPVVFWLLLENEMQLACIVFIIAGISDGLDGFLAKRFGWTTELGAHLDPFADKLLIVGVFAALGAGGHLPVWLVIAVVSRDLLIIAAVILAWLMHNPFRIRPQFVSKANTVAQLLLASVAMAHLGFGLALDNLLTGLVWVTGALTLASLASYMVAWVGHMGHEPLPRVTPASEPQASDVPPATMPDGPADTRMR